MRYSLRRYCALAATILAASCSFSSQDNTSSKEDIMPEIATGFDKKSVTTSQTDMVTAANPLAVQAGHDILKKGGSAVDAAIAVQLVLNLVEPQSSGIGGGGFLVHYDAKTKSLLSFDGRETAPSNVKETVFLDENGDPSPLKMQLLAEMLWGFLALSICFIMHIKHMAHYHGRNYLNQRSNFQKMALHCQNAFMACSKWLIIMKQCHLIINAILITLAHSKM